MSAFIVSKEHIKAMLRAAMNTAHRGDSFRWLAPEVAAEGDYQQGEPWGSTAVANATRRWRDLTCETINETGRMLLTENVRSVCHRYNEPMDSSDLPGPIGFSLADATFTYPEIAMGKVLEPVAVLKAIACYEYQSCEHPGWEGSEEDKRHSKCHTCTQIAAACEAIAEAKGEWPAPVAEYGFAERKLEPGEPPIGGDS